MSITADIKNEIAKREITEDCCNSAFLSALIHTAGSLVFEGNNKVAIEIYAPCFKAEYAEGLYGVSITDKAPTGRTVARVSGERVTELLSDLGILVRTEDGVMSIIKGIDKHLIHGGCCKASYVRGAFLGAGALSIVKKGGYHLQFTNRQEEFCNDFADLLSQISIPSKVIMHGDKHFVYIKDSQSMSDVLALIGADKAVLKLNNNLVEREVSRSVNRENNCFLANLDKTVAVSFEQCRAIERLKADGLLDELGNDYVKLSETRVDNPNMTYQELSENLGISKSAVKYKLDKIVELERRIRK